MRILLAVRNRCRRLTNSAVSEFCLRRRLFLCVFRARGEFSLGNFLHSAAVFRANLVDKSKIVLLFSFITKMNFFVVKNKNTLYV